MSSCAACGGAVDGDGLELAITAGPGRRGDGSVQLFATVYDRGICGHCLESDDATVLRRLLSGEFRRAGAPHGHCEVRCRHPKRRTPIFQGRTFRRRVRCPHCYGQAWVTADEGAIVWRPTVLQWLLRKVPMRPVRVADFPGYTELPELEADDAPGA